MNVPSVVTVDYMKKNIFSRTSSRISCKIREKLSDDDAKFIAPAIFNDKKPTDLVIDKENNLMSNQDYNQNLLNNKFKNKTIGLNGNIGISHGKTKDSSVYPNQKNSVYK